jgi:zinc transport system substrate-binding protein
MEAKGMELLPYRASGTFEAHAHAADGEDHGHEDEADHAAEHEHDHDGGMDGHIWLDPDNARAMVDAVAAELAEADPANATAYRENAERLRARLDALDAELDTKLAPLRDVPFVVFHDAYQYFDRHYGLSNVGSITVSPERQPGAQRLMEIRSAVTELGAACVLSEPQFEPKLVATVIEGTGARTGVLDPLGAAQEPGPDAYFGMMRANAAALAECLNRRS